MPREAVASELPNIKESKKMHVADISAVQERCKPHKYSIAARVREKMLLDTVDDSSVAIMDISAYLFDCVTCSSNSCVEGASSFMLLRTRSFVSSLWV